MVFFTKKIYYSFSIVFILHIISCQKNQNTEEFNLYYTKAEQLKESYDYQESLNYAFKCLNIAEEYDDSEMFCKSYNLLSVLYFNLGLYKESLAYTNQALNEDYIKKDYEMELDIYDIRAQIYTDLGLYELARNEASKIIKPLSSSPITNSKLGLKLANAYEKIGIAYGMENNSTDSLYKYVNKSIVIQKRFPIEEVCKNLSLSYLQKAQSLIIDHKMDSARATLDLSMKLKQENEDNYPMDAYFEELGNYYYYNDKYQKAIDYYLKALQELKSYNSNSPYTQIIYRVLADIYHEKGDFAKEQEYLNIYTEELEKQKIKTQKETSYALKLLMEQQKSERQKVVRRFVAFSIPIFCIILFISFYYFREKKKRKNVEIASSKQLKLKSRETEILKRKINDSFEEIIEMAKDNHPNFWTRFQEVYPEFRLRLLEESPNLKVSELTFCAYIYLGFTTKEIASYTFKAVKTVENNRYNLRKKLNISPETDLLAWLQGL